MHKIYRLWDDKTSCLKFWRQRLFLFFLWLLSQICTDKILHANLQRCPTYWLLNLVTYMTCVYSRLVLTGMHVSLMYVFCFCFYHFYSLLNIASFLSYEASFFISTTICRYFLTSLWKLLFYDFSYVYQRNIKRIIWTLYFWQRFWKLAMLIGFSMSAVFLFPRVWAGVCTCMHGGWKSDFPTR